MVAVSNIQTSAFTGLGRIRRHAPGKSKNEVSVNLRAHSTSYTRIRTDGTVGEGMALWFTKPMRGGEILIRPIQDEVHIGG